MAFVQNEQENPALQPPVGQQAPVSAGGAGVSGGTKTPSTPGVNVPAQPSAQLSAYLGANKDQATNFAGNIAGNLSAQVDAAGKAIQPAANAYTGNLYSVPTDAALNAQVSSSPSSLTPEQAAAYKAELGAASKAPNPTGKFETTPGYQSLTSGIQKSVEQADLWNSGNNVANLTTALAPFEGANATSGVKTLDALLLSQNPEAYNQIRSAVAPAADLSGKLSAATDSSNAALNDAIVKDQAATAAATASGNQYATGLSKTLADYLAQAEKNAGTYNDSVNTLTTQVGSLQPQIAALKDAISNYNAMRGANGGTQLLPVINAGQIGNLPATAQAPALNTLATPQQYSDVAALLNLMGDNAPNLSISPADAALAGTYKSPTDAMPIVNNIVDPFRMPVQEGIGLATDVYAAHPDNPALANDYASFSALQDAYKALDAAMNGIPIPPSDPSTPKSGGGGLHLL